ncbi:MAG: cell wall biosynthesis protein [archaeon]|nr:cell wall biosynthesis protein [archaeon]
MIYWTLIKIFILIFVLSIAGTMVLEYIFRYFGTKGYLGNLYPNIRGGIPKAIGIIPFILLSFLLLPPFNSLVLVIGIFALIDDILGKTPTPVLGIEWGQLSKTIAFLLVIIIGIYSGLGVAAILIALMVQPINISDMQPGSTCIVTMIMCIVTIIVMLIVGSPLFNELPAFYTPLLIFLVVLGYSPLDFSGRVLLGSVGNHSLAIALGAAFYLIGGAWWVLLLFIATVFFTAFVRRNNLYCFLSSKLGIVNPNYEDLFMDVLTGGGVCDLCRKFIFDDKQKIIENKLLIKLGFRRLVYNPYAPNHRRYDSNERTYSLVRR